MTDHFQDRMAEAARLMRSGRLQDATAAIQSALGFGPGAEPGADRPAAAMPEVIDVIDVEARVVDERPSAAGASDAGVQPPPAGTSVGETFSRHHFQHALGARDYKLYEPARDGRPLPLVVMLHGCTQDPDDFARGTAMNALARAHGFLVLYPAQSGRANPQRCWNWFKHNHQGRERGEPGLLAAMVRDVMARHDVDPHRVYVAGLSAGGAMAAILGDAYPELFAAVGVHSGLPTGAANDAPSAFAAMGGAAPPKPRAARSGASVPTVVFHGDADTTVHPLNGERVLDAAAAAEGEAASTRGRAPQGRGYTRRVRRDARGREIAEHWTIHGAGHAWSGGDPAGSYTDPTGPDASAEMLRFFLAHPKT